MYIKDLTGDIMEDFAEVEIPFDLRFMAFMDRTFRSICIENNKGAHKLPKGRSRGDNIESNMDCIMTSLKYKYYDSFQIVYWKHNMGGSLSTRYGGDITLTKDGWRALVVEFTAEILGVDKDIVDVFEI